VFEAVRALPQPTRAMMARGAVGSVSNGSMRARPLSLGANYDDDDVRCMLVAIVVVAV
jgi:hypothetical protein